ncbi:O-methyltransferase [Algisphaera agarilytica]|uniref:Putative O-methyltransferase YrrM n=1 Tax=Algisphaera agarilytica TaxID=1385975 RepID=A0A7X0H3J3_9BACT|nr:class I SAM-dependent methyltransferase [Algisphaera agarilytica]MBB6428554.1 putative O-methyltransferase YrrM [Algisphaera agarilytica]
MSTRSFLVQGDLADYLGPLAGSETDIQRRLSEASDRLPEAEMKSSPEAARVLAMLVKLTGARRAFEVGTFTGYSALRVAEALPDDGELVCCDVSDTWPAVGRPFWEEAGVADRIDLRIGDASQTLRTMIGAGDAGAFDFGFIDADKTGYPTYYDLGLELLRPGGLMVFDNALRHGAVARQDVQDADTVAIREVNQRAFEDEQVEAGMLLLGDGLLLVRKR